MRTYRSGPEFEQAVFGIRSDWEWMREKFGGISVDFSRSIRRVVENSGVFHPSTQLGASIHGHVVRQLRCAGIDPEGLAFLPCGDTELDLLHGADGFFYHPSLWPHLITVDAFNMNPYNFLKKRGKWIDEPKEDKNKNGVQIFSNEDVQNQLFSFKRGMTKWYKDNQKALEAEALGKGPPVIIPEDFRPFADRGRWENHFILTPYHTSSYGRRRDFARMVARYLAKAAKVPDCQKMAQCSP